MANTDVLPRATNVLTAHVALINRVRQTQQLDRRRLASSYHESTRPNAIRALLDAPLIQSSNARPVAVIRTPSPPSPKRTLPDRPELPPAKKARMVRYANYIPEEETVRNDYPQHYVDTGEWPQNWVQGAEFERRFEEYPKQRRLLSLKKAAVAAIAHPPMHLSHAIVPDQASHTALLNRFSALKFDVIVLDPFYSSQTWTWDDLAALPVPQLAGDPSFVFMWVGNGSNDGLERGREVLAKWGYRRCEDIVWVKTNKKSNAGPGSDVPTSSLLTHTKEHCLMGIKGTVRRSTDSWFVHCNIDTDVIIWEGDPKDTTRKPPEMYELIENFCLGMRRLELFGRPSSLRRGWLTVGDFEKADLDLPDDVNEWDVQSYESFFREGVRNVVPNTQEIESLRPKSPNRGNNMNLHAPPPNTQRAVPRPPPGQGMPGQFMQRQQQPQQQQHMMPGGMGQPMSVQLAYQQQMQAQAQQAQQQAAAAGFPMFGGGVGDGVYAMGNAGYGVGWMQDGGMGMMGGMNGMDNGMNGMSMGMGDMGVGGMGVGMDGMSMGMPMGSGIGLGMGVDQQQMQMQQHQQQHQQHQQQQGMGWGGMGNGQMGNWPGTQGW